MVSGFDRRLGRRPGRIDDADQREHRQVVHLVEQVGAGVEAGGGEVPARGCDHAQTLGGEPLVLGQVPRFEIVIGRRDGEVGVEVGRRSGQELVGRALDEAADDLLPGLVGHAVERRHQLVGGVERQLCNARVALARARDVQAALRGKHDQRAFGRVADHLAVRRDDRVAGERQRQHELLQVHRGLAEDVRDLAFGRVAGPRDRVAAAGDRELDRGHLVERQGPGLVGADGRGGAQRLGRAKALDDRACLGQQAGAARQDRGHDRRQPGRDRRDREGHAGGEHRREALPARHVDRDRCGQSEPRDRDQLLGQPFELHGQRRLRVFLRSSIREIWPTSVAMPVEVTTNSPVPRVTLVFM